MRQDGGFLDGNIGIKVSLETLAYGAFCDEAKIPAMLDTLARIKPDRFEWKFIDEDRDDVSIVYPGFRDTHDELRRAIVGASEGGRASGKARSKGGSKGGSQPPQEGGPEPLTNVLTNTPINQTTDEAAPDGVSTANAAPDTSPPDGKMPSPIRANWIRDHHGPALRKLLGTPNGNAEASTLDLLARGIDGGEWTADDIPRVVAAYKGKKSWPIFRDSFWDTLQGLRPQAVDDLIPNDPNDPLERHELAQIRALRAKRQGAGA